MFISALATPASGIHIAQLLRDESREHAFIKFTLRILQYPLHCSSVSAPPRLRAEVDSADSQTWSCPYFDREMDYSLAFCPITLIALLPRSGAEACSSGGA
jgi:hypothetical protein